MSVAMELKIVGFGLRYDCPVRLTGEARFTYIDTRGWGPAPRRQREQTGRPSLLLLRAGAHQVWRQAGRVGEYDHAAYGYGHGGA